MIESKIMLDNKDMRLIYELNWNCRQTEQSLAHELHISKQVINYRIKQLEKEGIILSYHALIDWRKLGYNAVRIYIKWKNIDPEVENKIYQDIKQDPFFMWTVKFEGEFDIGFYLWVKSVNVFAEKWFTFLAKYKKYILKQEISESVNMIHYSMKPLVQEYTTEEKIVGMGDNIKYDHVDYQILQAMTENAKISIVDLAKRINFTPKAAIYRLKRLQKEGVILGYNALINVNKLGYYFYKIDFYLSSMEEIKEMFKFAKSDKNIVYRMRTIGGPDFEIEAMVKSVGDMKNLINQIRKKFKNIEFYRFHRFEYTIKQVYLPGEKLWNIPAREKHKDF